MGKYANVHADIFSVFNSTSWKAESIKTYPESFVPMSGEYIRVSIITSRLGISLKSVSGILIIDIFKTAGKGPKEAYLIADKLDTYLQGKTLSTSSGGSTQFGSSTASSKGEEGSLFRVSYTIPFNYFGVS